MFDKFENTVNENMACPNCGKHGEHKCSEPPAKKLCICKDLNIVRLADCPIHGVGMEQPPVEEKPPFPLSEVSKESHELANKIMSFFRVGTRDDDGKFIYADPNRLAYLIDSKKPSVEAKDLEKVAQKEADKIEPLRFGTNQVIKDAIFRVLTESTAPLLRKIEELERQLRDAINKYDSAFCDKTKLQSQIAVKDERLKRLHDFISTLPSGIFGEGKDASTGMTWPIRDEVLDSIAKALTTDGSELVATPEKPIINGKTPFETSLDLLVKAKDAGKCLSEKELAFEIAKSDYKSLPFDHEAKKRLDIASIEKSESITKFLLTLTLIETFLKENNHLTLTPNGTNKQN